MTEFRGPLPVLPIHALDDAGVFDLKAVAGERSSELIYDLRVPGISCSARYRPEQEIVELTVGDVFHEVLIDNGPRRRFFVCSCCWRSRTALVLENERLICRETYRSSGHGFSKNVRGARFTMAIGELLQDRPVAKLRTPKPTPRPYFLATSIIKTTNQRPVGIPNYSTEKAMELGWPAGAFLLTQAHLNTSPEMAKGYDTAPGYVKPKFSSLTNAHPVLNVNTVRKDLMEYNGSVFARTLCWGSRDCVHEEVLLIVDWREHVPTSFVIHRHSDHARRYWQRLPMFRQVSGRFRWRCPVLNENCDVLYLRNGLFASRRAQSLYAPSQRALGRAQLKEGSAPSSDD